MTERLSYIFAFILLTFSIACGQPIETVPSSEAASQPKKADIRIENLKKQATEMYETLNGSGDFEKMADLTHPKAFEIAGSRENYIAYMRKGFQMTKEIFESFSWTIGTPSNLVEIDGQLFGIVPRTLSGVTVKKTKTIQEGSIIGVSTDNGKTWKFVNGTNFKVFFPAYVDKISIPEQVTYVDGIKQ